MRNLYRSMAALLIVLGLALTAPCGAVAGVMDFESVYPGPGHAPVPNGWSVVEDGMRATSFSDHSHIGDNLILGFGGNWFYFHGTHQYLEFRMVDGSRFDLHSLDLGSNGLAHRWIETSAAASRLTLHVNTAYLHQHTHYDFSGADYQDLEWFRVGTPYFGTQVDNVVFSAVPEPSTFALLSLSGLFGLVLSRRRKK